MADLPASAETPETAGSPRTSTDLQPLLDAPRVIEAQDFYAAAAENARRIALGWREQMAAQEGNTVT